jgi:hypothetical protein
MIDLDLMGKSIQNVLSDVTGIVKAYDHEPQTMSQFPAATLYFDGFGQTEKTTRRNSLDWNWIIRIYIRLNSSDIQKPQIEIRNLIQNTIKQFRTDPGLAGTCLFHTIGNGEVFTLVDQTNPLMIAELTLTATTQE